VSDRHPLFEFMPYGAPELLTARQPHLSRALVLASSFAGVAFLAALVLAPSLPHTVVVELPPVIDMGRTLAPPPSIETPPAASVPAVAVRPHAGPALPVPVPDATAPPEVTPTPGGAAVIGEPDAGDGSIAEAPPRPVATVVETRLPEIGEYVYTDEMPVAAKIVEPVYPDMALELGVDGRVRVMMLVGTDGHVIRAEVDPKCSVPMLDEAALVSARKWVFKPGIANGHAVAVWVSEVFIFIPHR